MELLVTVTFFQKISKFWIRSFRLLFLGNGIVSSLNKTANDNNLDLAILKNAIGHTILDVESLDEEMGELKTWQSKILENLTWLQFWPICKFNPTIFIIDPSICQD